ncbi:hypothetical protein [Burkholderia anthina]|nr:hypothetical protein [Burkholderia anthina]
MSEPASRAVKWVVTRCVSNVHPVGDRRIVDGGGQKTGLRRKAQAKRS